MTQKSCLHTQQMLNINVSSCSTFKMQSVISDMFFTERRSPFSESEGGNDWFLRAKKFSKFPLHYWHEMNNFVPLFLALFNWLSFFDLYISFFLSFFLSLFTYLFIYLLIYLFIYFYEFIYSFIYLFAYLFVCLFIYLSIYLSFLFIFHLLLTNYN